jgi:hypothetical protein
MAIEKAKNEREQAEYTARQDKELVDQKRQANYGLVITIEARQEQLTDNDGYYVSALVKVINKGIKNRFINYSKPPLLVERIVFDEHGNSELSFVLKQKNVTSDSIVLRTGTTVDYPFLIKVRDKGLYIVSFLVELNEEEMKIHKQSGGPDEKGISWAGTAFVLVK